MKRLLRHGAATRRLSAIVLVLASSALFRPIVAHAQPSNDNFANATVITSLPFSDVVDVTAATTEPDEPQGCVSMAQTVWYSFTPGTTTSLRADTMGTAFAANLNVYQAGGPGFAGLNFVGCSFSSSNAVSFTAQAGTTYYIQAGSVGGAGYLHVHVAIVPPPANDNFANATTVGSLPFSDTVDMTAATLESGEPTPSCGGFGAPAGSVWYTFTPSVSESVSSSITNADFSTEVAAYTGTALTSLNDQGCRAFGNVLTIAVKAGQTYSFQVEGLPGPSGSLTFNLIVTPPPIASFNFFPFDPSIFDAIQFQDFSQDPGELGIQSEVWNFGDGATATGCCPTHRYATDADYTVHETVTTPDGRTASTQQTVQVQTHDVAITTFGVPTTAREGQTKLISVGVSDSRYPESVQVQLAKSTPGGFVPVGTLTQSVPVQKAKGTVLFAFSYTFTSDDALAGTVSFQAIATISGYRDALPANNTAISLPTRVSH